MTTQCVEVKLELGHKAVLRTKPTTDGFTHDWTVYVRGPENCSIQHFVEKIVFHLHESFPKPKRVLKEPPYQVSESGYAGFNMPIEVHFRNKEEPKKVQFEYDLYLHLEGPPINNVRFEKLTFQNPTDEFRRKLLKSGGTTSGVNSASSGASQQVKTETENHLQSTKVSKGIIQVPKKTPKTKTAVKDVVHVPQPKVSHPFTDIFGPPIKRKPSPEPTLTKSKENVSQKIAPSKHPKVSGVSVAPSKENKHGSKEKEKQHGNRAKVAKEHRSEVKESKGVHSKRPPSPMPDIQLPVGKRRRTVSTSSSGASKMSTDLPAEVKEVKNVEKEKRRGDKEEKKHKSKTRSESTPRNKDKDKEKSHKSSQKKETNAKVEKQLLPPPQKDDNSCSSFTLGEDVPSQKVKERLEVTKAEEDSSRGSSISLSPSAMGGAHGPLAAMMEEMEQELVSPLSSDPSSPVAMPVFEKGRPETPPLPPPMKVKTNSSTPPPKGRPCTPILPKEKTVISETPPSSKNKSSAKLTQPLKNRANVDTTFVKNRASNDAVPPKNKVSSDVPLLKNRVSTESPPPKNQATINNPTKNRSLTGTPPPKQSRVRSDTPPPPKHKPVNNTTPTKSKASNESQPPKIKAPSEPLPLKNRSSSGTPPPLPPPKSTLDSDCSPVKSKAVNDAALSAAIVKETSSDSRYSKQPVDEAYLSELIELQKRIAALRDQNHLQRIVDVIEETGLYRVTDSTFDFDLCALDRSTVQKLQSCLAVK